MSTSSIGVLVAVSTIGVGVGARAGTVRRVGLSRPLAHVFVAPALRLLRIGGMVLKEQRMLQIPLD